MRESRVEEKGRSRGGEGRSERMERTCPKYSLPYSARTDSVPNPLL